MRLRLLHCVLIAALAGTLDQYVTYGRAGTPPLGIGGKACDGAGFNNRWQALKISLIVAVATNRTLAVQPFTFGHNAGQDVPYTRFFQIDWPTVPASELAGKEVKELPVSPSTCDKGLAAIAAHDATKAPILRYPACYGWWDSILRPEDYAVARSALDRLKLVPQWEAAAAELRTALPPVYNAVHFRLGDRPGLALDCAPGEPHLRPWQNPTLVGKQTPTEARNNLKSIAKQWGWDNCPLMNVEDAYDAWGIHAQGVGHWPLYISTNRPSDPRAVALGKETNSIFWDDIPEDVRQRALKLVGFQGGGWRDGAAVSLLEQLICIGSNFYLPAWPSSWEQFVLHTRVRLQKADAAPQLASMLSAVTRHMSSLGPGSGCKAPAAGTPSPVAQQARPLLASSKHGAPPRAKLGRQARRDERELGREARRDERDGRREAGAVLEQAGAPLLRHQRSPRVFSP